MLQRRYSLIYTITFPIITLLVLFAAYASFSSVITFDSVLEMGIPIMTVDTEAGKKIKSTEKYLKASYLLYEAGNEKASWGGKCRIRGRGNTTWRTRELYKKPYLLKLDEEEDLLGFAPAKKWVLMANTADKTQLRNSYATYLATKIFNTDIWQPQNRFIALFVNGSYNGLYALTEKIECIPGRLPVSEEEGSFLFEVNNRLNRDYNFTSKNGVRFSIRTLLPPDNARFLKEQEIIQKAEDILFGENFTDKENGWRSMLDESSFADWYLVNELTKNHDAKFQSSCYLYYDVKKDKIFMGPSWDFDIACGNINWDDCHNPEGYWVSNARWYERLFQDKDFVTLVHSRWFNKRTEVDESLDWLEKEAESLYEHIMLNDAVWKNIGHRQWPHAPGWKSRKTYKDELNYMKSFLEKRIIWLDKAFQE